MRGRRAGVVSRLLVAGVDFFVVAVLLFALLVAFAAVRYMLGSGTFKLPRAGPVFTGTGYPIVEFVYLAVAWSLTGRSVGKQLFGLRVVRGDGAKLGRLRACGRAAWCTVFGIPSLLWAAVSTRNAGVHDLVFRTAVVHDWAEVAGGPDPAPSPALDPSPAVPAPGTPASEATTAQLTEA